MRRDRLIFLGGLLVAAIAAGVVLLVSGGDDEGGDASTAVGNCETTTLTDPRQVSLDPPAEEEPSGDDLTATVTTSEGDIEIALDTENSPKTVASFEYLVDEGVYDCTNFQRVIDGFVIQGGDPQGDGLGGPGYTVTEPPPGDTAYTKDVVAMAKSPVEPPGSSGSQFFIVTGADAGLEPDYAVLGEVVGGEDVVEKIESYADPTGASEEPTTPVAIESVSVG